MDKALLCILRAAVAGICTLLSAPPVAAQPCGGEGQRACCFAERSFGACQRGLTEVPRPNAGRCGGINPAGIQSSGICIRVTPCGRAGERACCIGESSFGACQSGLAEVERPNSGQCAGALPGVQSSGVCVEVAPCGQAGQRACCIGESSFGACTAGLVQVPRPNSGQCAGALPGVQSSGVCATPTPCGGNGERACCVGESPFGACRGGLQEIAQPNSGQCAGALPGIQSSGVCRQLCGNEGQPACTGPASVPACGPALVNSRGTCRRPGDCGRDGFPPCVAQDARPACDAGLEDVDAICQLPYDRPVTIRLQTVSGRVAQRPTIRARTTGPVAFLVIDGAIEDDATDAGFIKRRGLADRRCASYESTRFPGRFLWVPALRARLTTLFVAGDPVQAAKDMTFCRKPMPGAPHLLGYEPFGRTGEFLSLFEDEVWLTRLERSSVLSDMEAALLREVDGRPVLPLSFEGFLTAAATRDGDDTLIWLFGECSPIVTRQDLIERFMGRPARTSDALVDLRYAPLAAPAPNVTHRRITNTASTLPFARFAPLIQLRIPDPLPRPMGVASPSAVSKITRIDLPCSGEWADDEAKALLRQLGALP